jgi:hypothetical protein
LRVLSMTPEEINRLPPQDRANIAQLVRFSSLHMHHILFEF